MSLHKNIMILFLACTINAFAADKVIDLGQLEVEGELRRPKVEWIDADKKVSGWISKIHENEFYELEKNLLKPISVKEAESIIRKEVKNNEHS